MSLPDPSSSGEILFPFATGPPTGPGTQSVIRVQQDLPLERIFTPREASLVQRVQAFVPAAGAYEPVRLDPERLSLDAVRGAGGELARNASASLLDLGEGVLCLEIHSGANVIDAAVVAMGERALYIYPGMEMGRGPTEEEQRAWQAKYEAGPAGIVVFNPRPGGNFGTWRGTELGLNMLAALMASIVMLHVPASFVTTIEAGRSTTSPAAIWSTSASGRRWIRGRSMGHFSPRGPGRTTPAGAGSSRGRLASPLTKASNSK